MFSAHQIALVPQPLKPALSSRAAVDLKETAWEMLLARWVELSPRDALTFVRNTPGLASFEAWCFHAWSLADPVAALREAELPPRKHLLEVVDALTERHLDEAFALMQRHPDDMELRDRILRRWARSDGQRALAGR